MITNLERFKKDLGALVDTGQRLSIVIQLACFPEKLKPAIEKQFADKAEEFIKELPNFFETYQRWYSEALVLLQQLLPDRVDDFRRHYEKPKTRKEITSDNYSIEDYLQGLSVTRTYGLQKETVVGPDAAILRFKQQVAIVEAAQARFDSSLFDIRRLVQADLLDSELDAAEELLKHKFFRAAGAVAGVVLERHLAQVRDDHGVTIAKKHPTISDFNEALKANGVIDVPQWRFIQHLGDIRNLCDHGRTPDPTSDQIQDLIAGVKKITKTVF